MLPESSAGKYLEHADLKLQTREAFDHLAVFLINICIPWQQCECVIVSSCHSSARKQVVSLFVLIHQAISELFESRLQACKLHERWLSERILETIDPSSKLSG